MKKIIMEAGNIKKHPHFWNFDSPKKAQWFHIFTDLPPLVSVAHHPLLSGGRVNGVPDGPREAANARPDTRPQLSGAHLIQFF